MKKVLFGVFMLLSLKVAAQVSPVFLYFASHNETTDQQFHGLNYNSLSGYSTMKGYVRRVCDSIIHYNAKYDMMLESNFILGCIQYDNAATSSTDLIEWANNQPQIEVEPHNHFKATGIGANPYNYADLVYLLDSCGVDTAKVMGGFIWRNFTMPVAVNEDWTAWQTPKAGYTFPRVSWQPTLLWGGGSPNHIADLNTYGVWKPRDATTTGFVTHTPSQTLTNFGGGCGEDFVLTDTTDALKMAYRIMNFADSVQAHYTGTPNAFFTLKVMMNFRHFPAAGYIDKLGTILRTIQPYINNNKLQYKSIMESYDTWQTLHTNPNDSYIRDCSNTVMLSNTPPTLLTSTQNISATESRNISISPNPSHDAIYITTNLPIQKYEIYNVLGYLMQNNILANNTIAVADLPKGIYFIKFYTQNGNNVQKIIRD